MQTQPDIIAVVRPRLVSEAPLDVPDPDTAIDAIQASLPALMVPVLEPDRAEWVRRSVSRKARIVGLAGGLYGVQLAVFIVAAENANWTTGRNMRASLETLAREAGFSLSPVRRAVRALEDGAWMRCDYRSKGGLTARLGGAEPDQHVFRPDAAGRTRGQADQDEAARGAAPGTQAARIPVQRGPVGATGK